MKRFITILILFLSVFSYGQTSVESEMIVEINEIRKDPKSYIPKVESYIKSNEIMIKMFDNKNIKVNTSSTSGRSGKSIFVSRIKTARELISILDTLSPMGTLVFDSTMYEKTTFHGKYLDRTKVIGHYGPNGTTPYDRFGYDVGENVASSKNALINLMVDDGIHNRGHRMAILKRDRKFISIYISDFVVVQNFR